MTRYYLRIIADHHSEESEQAIFTFLHSLSDVSSLHTQAIQPYWKNPGQGEVSASFVSGLSMEKIQGMLADRWESNTADVRWSMIYVPHAAFLWLSA